MIPLLVEGPWRCISACRDLFEGRLPVERWRARGQAQRRRLRLYEALRREFDEQSKSTWRSERSRKLRRRDANVNGRCWCVRDRGQQKHVEGDVVVLGRVV
jgi:hypothetical protein